MGRRNGNSIQESQHGPRLAVAYVRMSTEHQQYSTENQLDTIKLYAAANSLEITKVYRDTGKSGLRLEGRHSLIQLFKDVEGGLVEFSVILVYDVSRWGRFQDPDIAASFEVRCRQAGVAVHYCAEQFANDGSPFSNIVKNLKRMMAGEYSRELSVKVFAGQSRLIQMGFRQGGVAGYGLRRQLVDFSGQSKGELGFGEHKSIQTDRVKLIPGPASEIETVQWIYRQFVESGYSEAEIAEQLNLRSPRTDFARPWSRGTVHQVLTNEKYIGNNVWNRSSFKLRDEHVRNPPREWIRSNGAFSALVSPVLFAAAQEIILTRSYRMPDAEMLERLKKLYEKCGCLSGFIINESEDCPSSTAYQYRFGSLLRTYSLIGYMPVRDYAYIAANHQLRLMHPLVLAETIERIQQLGGRVCVHPINELLIVNGELLVSLVLCRHQSTGSGTSRWKIRFDTGLSPDITVAVRMEPNGKAARDYYIFPRLDIEQAQIRLAEYNASHLEIYRYDSLEALAQLSRRTVVGRAA
ncbi:recombinase family protein [Pseudomonas sp. LP_7_YM]|uniref:recombinase family protein n=1 Tax=Pseudomonas sp. LP_7_YM TaxID=2485137 RepID=UPI00105C35E7|nr:recombinase family protein [Pseudomonas sp. LP_7_YM]TDV59911.1 DNA invertase Pin-like site-specific DNA recombinase [Pseudomonas sp. LP_7_YM]